MKGSTNSKPLETISKIGSLSQKNWPSELPLSFIWSGLLKVNNIFTTKKKTIILRYIPTKSKDIKSWLWLNELLSPI